MLGAVPGTPGAFVATGGAGRGCWGILIWAPPSDSASRSSCWMARPLQPGEVHVRRRSRVCLELEHFLFYFVLLYAHTFRVSARSHEGHVSLSESHMCHTWSPHSLFLGGSLRAPSAQQGTTPFEPPPPPPPGPHLDLLTSPRAQVNVRKHPTSQCMIDECTV